MSSENRLVIRINGRDQTALLATLLGDTIFTDRELDILKTLVKLATTEVTPEVRRYVKEYLKISRENLNNMLIRMQAKGVFDKQWKISHTFGPLFEPFDEILLKLR